jgi:hypothetical protein
MHCWWIFDFETDYMYENLCGWGRFDIGMTFHMRAFDFFYTIPH